MSSFLPDFGNLLYTAGAFVLALSIIVTIHEFGHYIVGRWSGIHAEVFSLGFGPRLLSRTDRRGTRWQLCALPLGGYVKFLGDANAASAGADPAAMAHLSPAEIRRTMHGAPLWARAATVAAGPAFNFLLSILIFAGMALALGQATQRPTVGALTALPGGAGDLRAGDVIVEMGGRPVTDWESFAEAAEAAPASAQVPMRVERGGQAAAIAGPNPMPPRFSAVAPMSAAYEAGLQAGDVVVRAGGETLVAFAQLQAAVTASAGAPVDLRIWRPLGKGGVPEEFEVTLRPKSTDLPVGEGFETRWLIGASGGYAFEPATEATGPLEALWGGVRQTWAIITGSLRHLVSIVAGEISSCNLRGAIGIAETSAAAASSGAESFIWFIASLSTAVGFLNLFPIPVLDGGHLVFHAYEALRGRPPSDRIYGLLTAVGMAAVLTLMLFGLSNDLFCP